MENSITLTVEYETETEDGEDYLCEDIEFEYEFDYEAGYEGNFRGHPDNWEPGYGSEFSVTCVWVRAFGRWYEIDVDEFLSMVDVDHLCEQYEEGLSDGRDGGDYDDYCDGHDCFDGY